MSQVELFLNSVPILAPLSRDERLRLVDAFEESTFTPGSKVIVEGDRGDLFYIIKEGEAIVFQNTQQGQRKVNHLFKADFFGERALLSDEPRQGSHTDPLSFITLVQNTSVPAPAAGVACLTTRRPCLHACTQDGNGRGIHQAGVLDAQARDVHRDPGPARAADDS